MKKIYTILFALTLAATAAQAQRIIRLRVTIDTPVAAQNMITGSTIQSRYTLKNLGPDSLRTTDTLFFQDSGMDTLNVQPLWNLILPAGGSLVMSGEYVPFLKIPFKGIRGLLPVSGSTDKRLIAPFVNNTQYAWYAKITGVSSLASTDVITFNPAGSMDTVHIWINKSTSAIHEVAFDASFKTYPNPAANQLSFEYNFTSNDKVTATILDVTGRTIMTKQIENSGTGNQKSNLDINAINSGMYFLRLQIGDKSVVTKFNIQK